MNTKMQLASYTFKYNFLSYYSEIKVFFSEEDISSLAFSFFLSFSIEIGEVVKVCKY